MTEAQLQAALIQWADHQPFRCGNCRGRIGEYLLHVSNGGSRSWRTNPNTGKRFSLEGQRFRAMGVRPGVPDLFLAVPTDTSSGLWLEMKRPGAIRLLTVEQMAWIGRLESAGYQVDVCDSFDSAVDAIRTYLGMGDGEGERMKVA